LKFTVLQVFLSCMLALFDAKVTGHSSMMAKHAATFITRSWRLLCYVHVSPKAERPRERHWVLL